MKTTDIPPAAHECGDLACQWSNQPPAEKGLSSWQGRKTGQTMEQQWNNVVQVLQVVTSFGPISGLFRACWWPPCGESKGQFEEAGWTEYDGIWMDHGSYVIHILFIRPYFKGEYPWDSHQARGLAASSSNNNDDDDDDDDNNNNNHNNNNNNKSFNHIHLWVVLLL